MESENSNILPSSQSPQDTKEARKKQEKDRKKGEKKMEQFIKSIANCTHEEKVDALSKKNSESLDQVRTLKSTIQVLHRKIMFLEKEKEQLQNEQSKGVLARSRLETLCREFQRQNKSIKDESLQKIREEEEKRKEVSTRFQTALNEVSVMMQQNTDKNLKLRDDNIEISNKFQKLCDQFKQREEEVIRLTKQMDLEKQLAEATVKRIECQLNAERGIWNKEKEHYTAQLKFYEEEKLKFEKNIKNLEEHLSLYSNKYSDFESTIAKSNEVFDNYKVELNRMSKQIQKLEQENNIWKDKWLQSQHAFTNVTLEHRYCEQSSQERDKKLKNLADLCRSIQEERATYLKQLKENGLIPAVVVHVEKTNTEPEKVKPNILHKMTKKEKQLSLLKREMLAIEKQLADTLKTQNDTNVTENINLTAETKKSDENTTIDKENLNQQSQDESNKIVSESSINQNNSINNSISEIILENEIKSDLKYETNDIIQNINTSEKTNILDNAETQINKTMTLIKIKNPEILSEIENITCSNDKNISEKITSQEDCNNEKIKEIKSVTSTNEKSKENTLKEENFTYANNENEKSVPVEITSKQCEKEISQLDSNKNKNKSKGQKSKKNKK